MPNRIVSGVNVVGAVGVRSKLGLGNPSQTVVDRRAVQIRATGYGCACGNAPWERGAGRVCRRGASTVRVGNLSLPPKRIRDASTWIQVTVVRHLTIFVRA